MKTATKVPGNDCKLHNVVIVQSQHSYHSSEVYNHGIALYCRHLTQFQSQNKVSLRSVIRGVIWLAEETDVKKKWIVP